jgi:hypothetical protein
MTTTTKTIVVATTEIAIIVTMILPTATETIVITLEIILPLLLEIVTMIVTMIGAIVIDLLLRHHPVSVTTMIGIIDVLDRVLRREEDEEVAEDEEDFEVAVDPRNAHQLVSKHAKPTLP